MTDRHSPCSCGTDGVDTCPRCGRATCPSHAPAKGSRCAPCEAEYERRFTRWWFWTAFAWVAFLALALASAPDVRFPLVLGSTLPLGFGLLLIVRGYTRQRFLAEGHDEVTQEP
jgi:hypothetical protein